MSMRLTKEQKEYDLMLKKETELIKREDRLENVERIGRANDNKQ